MTPAAFAARAGLVTAALILSACTAATGPSNVYDAVAVPAPGEARVVFKAPGLAAAVRRALFIGNYEQEEYALYKGAGGAQAEVFFAEATPYGYRPEGGDYVVLEFNKTIRMAFDYLNMPKVARPVYAGSYPYKGKLRYYLQPFRRGDTGQSCFGFHAEFNGDAFDPQGRYDDQLFGYYCAPRGTTLTPVTIQSAIDGLDLAGITTPLPPGPPLRRFKQLVNDTALVALVRRGEPAGATGMVKFPMHLVRHYGDSRSDHWHRM